MVPKKVYVLFLLLTASAVLLIFLAPYLAYKNHTYVSLHIYKGFSSLCHQRPERSFFVWDHQIAVCARCTFLYIGILVGMLLYPFRFGKGVSVKVVLICGAPLILDGMTQLVFRESTNDIRALTGFLLGVILPFYVMPHFFKALK